MDGSSSTISAVTVAPIHLNFCTIPWHQRSGLKLSAFDVRLRKEWEKSLTRGFFLHGVESEPLRVAGSRGFVAVLCRNRASRKRKPQSFTKILQDIDPNSFNFTKVKDGEVLFQIASPVCMSDNGRIGRQDSKTRKILTSNDSIANREESCKTTVIVNNSPYEFGHCLLVPDCHKLLIQSVTFDALKMGIETLLYSSHPGFRVMYNSLCAGASVNHLHLHCYYTEYWLPSEAFKMVPLIDVSDDDGTEVSSHAKPYLFSDCFEIDFSDSCVHGFGFVITRQNYAFDLPNLLHKIVQYFNAKNIAHNIVIIRGLPPSEKYDRDEASMPCSDHDLCNFPVSLDQKKVIKNPNIPNLNDVPLYYDTDVDYHKLVRAPLVGRVYLFPRRPLFGEKCYRKFLVNVTELFSHLYFGDVEVFNSMSEKDVVEARHSVSLSESEFNILKRDVIGIIMTNEV